MSSERQNFLEFAQKRTDFINLLIENNGVYRQGNQVIRDLAPRFLAPFVKNLKLSGLENLEQAQSQVKSGKSLVMTLNHQSDADTYLIRYVLTKNGLKELADRAVYIAGLKMIERIFTRPFFASERALMVATPGDFEAISNFLKINPNLVDRDMEIMDKYQKSCAALNIRAGRELIPLIREGIVVGLYPEGTRTRSPQGHIQKASDKVASYFKSDRFDVLPIAMSGITTTFPVGSAPRILRRSDIDVVVGKIYPTSDVWNRDFKNKYPNPEQVCVDLVMAKIAMLNPKIVSFDDWLYYRDLLGQTA